LDYFAILGLPRRLNIDNAELEQRFRGLSRECHPDYFVHASPAERRASVERSSFLNDAYRTLKHPISRIEYLLELEGFPLKPHVAHNGSAGTSAASVPPALLEQVFELNEELDAARSRRARGDSMDMWGAHLARARAPVERLRDEHEDDLKALSERWDALVVGGSSDNGDRRATLAALRDRMLERNYIVNMLAAIDRELTSDKSSNTEDTE